MFWRPPIPITPALPENVRWRHPGDGCGRRNSLGWPPILGTTRDSRIWPGGLVIAESDRSVLFPPPRALRKLGALAFGSRVAAAYSDIDVIFLQQVARQVAVAVDNALNFEQAQSVQQQLKEERDRLRLLLDVNNTVVSVAGFARTAQCRLRVAAAPGAARICQPLAL